MKGEQYGQTTTLAFMDIHLYSIAGLLVTFGNTVRYVTYIVTVPEALLLGCIGEYRHITHQNQ